MTRFTAHHHAVALRALRSLSQSRPDVDLRAATMAGTALAKIVDAAYLLSEAAASFAMNERSRHSEAAFNAALALIQAAIPEAWLAEHEKLAADREAVDRAARMAAGALNNQPKKNGNSKDQKRAERLAGRLGLMDRNGKPYPRAASL